MYVFNDSFNSLLNYFISIFLKVSFFIYNFRTTHSAFSEQPTLYSNSFSISAKQYIDKLFTTVLFVKLVTII